MLINLPIRGVTLLQPLTSLVEGASHFQTLTFTLPNEHVKHIPGNCRTGEASDAVKLQEVFCGRFWPQIFTWKFYQMFLMSFADIQGLFRGFQSTDSTFTASNDFFLLPHSVSCQRPKAQRVRILFWGRRSTLLCKFWRGNVRKRYKNVDTLKKKKISSPHMRTKIRSHGWCVCPLTQPRAPPLCSHLLAQDSTLRKIICSGSPEWMKVASDCK